MEIECHIVDFQLSRVDGKLICWIIRIPGQTARKKYVTNLCVRIYNITHTMINVFYTNPTDRKKLVYIFK
jgi:hypothetical protein